MTLLQRVAEAIDTIERTPTEHDTAGVNGPFTALRDLAKGTMTPFRSPPQHGSPLVASVSLWWPLTGELPEATKAQVPEIPHKPARTERSLWT